jgi:hypothetical protein
MGKDAENFGGRAKAEICSGDLTAVVRYRDQAASFNSRA